MPTYTDTEILKNRQTGQAETYGMTTPATATAGAPAEIKKLHSLLVTFSKAADDAMASTATAETYTGKSVPWLTRLNNVRIVATTGGVATDNTNNMTLTIYKRDSAGANQLAIAVYTSNVAGGALTQGVPKVLGPTTGLTVANTIITADSTFTYAITKAGTGVVMRACEVILELEKI
jgi:hypothetical protein